MNIAQFCIFFGSFPLSEFTETIYRPSLISQNQFSHSLFVWQPCPYLSCRHLANVWTLELLSLFFIFVCFFFPVACSFSVCYNFVRPFPLRLALRLAGLEVMFLRFRFHFVAVHRQFLWPTTSSSPSPAVCLPQPVSRLLCLPRFGHCLLLTFYIILPHGCLCPGQDNFAAFACPSLHSPPIYLLYMYVCVYWHSENMLWPELLVIYLKPFKWQNLHGKRLSGLPGIPCLQATLDYIIKSVSQAK